MKTPPHIMDEHAMRAATASANIEMYRYLQRVDVIKLDANVIYREKKQECKTCYYLRGQGVSGRAMTERPCMCCQKDQTYASTSTNALCLECAKKHDLCARCGGDIHMDMDRAEWPEPEN